jgi:hypothetical protein
MLAVALAASCAHPPPPGTLPRRAGEGAPWFTAATPHFELYTQLDPDETVRLATLLEQARTALLATAWPLRRGFAGETARVVVVRGLERFGASRRGAVGGMTSWQPEVRQLGRSPLVVLNGNPENLLQLDSNALHELVHLLTESLDVDIPRWLHEGLAAYHEAMEVDARASQVRLGDLTDRRRLSLQQHPALALRDLFGWDSPRAELESYSVFTSNSLLLTHYLITEQGARFRQLQERLLAGVPWPAAWEQLFGPPQAIRLEAALTAYRQRPFAVRRVPVAFPPLPAVRAAPLTFSDVRAVRALLYRRTVGPMPVAERERRARIELDSSFGLDPLSARALEFGWTLLDAEEARVRARATWQARPWEWRVAALAASVVPGPEAVDILERTSRWHPEHRYLEAALALAYLEAQKYPDARRLAKQAVDRDSGDPYLLGVYGQCLIAGSACEQGREAIARALAAASGQGRHFPYDLAWLVRTCGVPLE